MAAVKASIFWKLVDEVLIDVGRGALKRGSPQRQIIKVEPTDRVLQILAGPGSGKTEMIVWRVLWELFVRETPSERIVVTTFTRKAATELSVRVVERSDQLLEVARKHGLTVDDPRVHDLRIGTIHSLCDSLMAEFDTQYMSTGAQLIDEVETEIRMAQQLYGALTNYGKSKWTTDILDDTQELIALFRPPWLEGERWPSSRLERTHLLRDILAQHIETWVPRCQPSGTLNGIESVHGCARLTEGLTKLSERWQRYLQENGVMDFATLQAKFLDAQDAVAPHISHVFVDEFQDTNPIQYKIHTSWLSHPNIRLTLVGDDDQALYRFRGSDIACFSDLQSFCSTRGISYRRAVLEENWRSTKTITEFTQAFKKSTILATRTMPKRIVAAPPSSEGQSVRLLEGPWLTLVEIVAKEMKAAQVGRPPRAETLEEPPTGAMLMFSTSERETKRAINPSAQVRDIFTRQGIRVYNSRNKTASDPGSPVQELFALLSYLFDPVTKAPLGKGGRMVDVWASNSNQDHQAAAVVSPPPFRIAAAHASVQKRFMKAGAGKVGAPASDRRDLVQYIDTIRERLQEEAENGTADKVRLTISGLIARILTFARYRSSGFTNDLFRQALFTNLLEANIAPTRLQKASLDQPLRPSVGSDGKLVWEKQFWSFLNLFGPYLESSKLDDPDVPAFSEHAFLCLTFHQCKGLEFDHVYVAGTGREAAPHSALRTALFSGNVPKYWVDNGQPQTKDKDVLELSEADREREVYVALSRAKKTLTILHDPSDDRPFMAANAGIQEVFAPYKARRHPEHHKVTIKEYTHAKDS